MIDRNFIVKNAKKFSEHNAKKFACKILTDNEKSSKNRNDFTAVMTSLIMFTQS